MNEKMLEQNFIAKKTDDTQIERIKAEVAEEDDYQTDDGSIFGSIESARQLLREVFGLNKTAEEQPSAPKAELAPKSDMEKSSNKEDTRRPKLVNFVETIVTKP